MKKILIVGAGVGGLSAAVDLSRQGFEVHVFDKEPASGGKMRRVKVGGVGVDAGPTVFTMHWVFEALFRDAGADLEERLQLQQASVLARHAWTRGGQLDLHADLEQSIAAIREFAGAKDAEGYRQFCHRSADIYSTLKDSFIAASRPNPLQLMMRVKNPSALVRTLPFKTLWNALAEEFADPRLRQLFARYSTYVGSSPALTPATLMLIAHVEQSGVWLVDGGMRAVARALQNLAEEHRAVFHFNTGVQEIVCARGRASGVITEDGTRIDADAVVFNGDVSALASGLLGQECRRATKLTAPEHRSLSAVTWCMNAQVRGFDAHYHNVFFAENYLDEFASIFSRRDIAAQPTVYVCAQDRGGNAAPATRERLLILINAPADGDTAPMATERIDELRDRALSVMRQCGCELTFDLEDCATTSPREWNQLFPSSGGALYGRASHGMNASFQRSGSRSRIPGLYLAGGSVHPGAGVPMAALSGRLAANRLATDLA